MAKQQQFLRPNSRTKNLTTVTLLCHSRSCCAIREPHPFQLATMFLFMHIMACRTSHIDWLERLQKRQPSSVLPFSVFYLNLVLHFGLVKNRCFTGFISLKISLKTCGRFPNERAQSVTVSTPQP